MDNTIVTIIVLLIVVILLIYYALKRQDRPYLHRITELSKDEKKYRIKRFNREIPNRPAGIP